MLIAPIIFCSVVHGIASMGDLKKVGRVGIKALVYFEVVTTLALASASSSSNVWQPGAGMNIDPNSLDTKSIASYAAKAKEQSVVGHLMHIIPDTVVGAFAEGEILQVLFLAILFAIALIASAARPDAARPHRPGRAHLLRHRRHRHARRADRRFRRHGIHHRQVRHRDAAVARQADGRRSTPPA